MLDQEKAFLLYSMFPMGETETPCVSLYTLLEKRVHWGSIYEA